MMGAAAGLVLDVVLKSLFAPAWQRLRRAILQRRDGSRPLG